MHKNNYIYISAPELVSEWHPKKNGEFTPKNVTTGSERKIWWVCDKGHEWIATVYHRVGNKATGCPYCSGKYLIKGENDLQTLRPDIAKEWNYSKNGEKKPYMYKTGSSIKVWWICKEGHEWQACVCHRTKKNSGCPYCSGRYAIRGINDLETLRPDIVKEWNYNKNGENKPYMYKVGSNKKVWWICKEGHEWQTLIVDRTRENGTNCPYCSGNLFIKGENDLETCHPELAKEWHPTKNGLLKPSDYAHCSGKKVWWICSKNHEWKAPIISRTRINAGCPYCSGQKVMQGFNDLATLASDIAKEWHPTKNGKLKATEVTFSSGRKAWWVCSKGHEWQAVISTRTGKDKCGCPYCYGRYAISGETDLATLRPDLIKEWHPTKNRNVGIESVKLYSNKKVWWKCENNHEWRTAVYVRAVGSNCPFCQQEWR